MGSEIAKLSVPNDISYPLFVSLVTFCYNHLALTCDIRPTQNAARKHAVTAILVPKRSKWVSRESLYSFVTPGHLLSPDLFLNYGHVVEYIRFIQDTTNTQREALVTLWDQNQDIKWGPYYILVRPSNKLGILALKILWFSCSMIMLMLFVPLLNSLCI